MNGARVAALFIHPLKSAARIAVNTLTLDERGAVNDRRWMLIDANGVGLTQRDNARLALIEPSIMDEALELRAPGTSALRIAIASLAPVVHRAIIWDDDVDVLDAGDAASAWVSAVMGAPCRLVRQTDNSPRPLKPKYAGALPFAGRRVALSDGAPLLLLSEGSIDALNARLTANGDEALGSERFRPNVLLSGVDAHEEDTWRAVTIGDVELGVGSLCVRCVVTTTNQKTLERGVEPLRTFATYRKQPGGVMFGVNATNARPGVIRLGDPVMVHERKDVTPPC